ncbi:DNA cytosine methyltransferase [uncultured Jatrophihabitans sp.]|uniref:DNA cytosine methyltransferase n=1 Tax=uncultured Jatrophihabitans sp. TaxID=1610747 RepID=UPI0035C9998B
MTAIDLFSGAGGGSLGLVQAGFDLRFAVEMDRDAALTHHRHLPGRTLQTDIRDLAPGKLLDAAGVGVGDLDLLFAGPPCQGFSMIGPRQISDLRNSLFREVLRVAEVMRPRAVVIENVPGLVTLADGHYLSGILSGLADLGYHAACAELLAAQYGAPQMRWRLVIIAWRSDLDIPHGFGFPTPSHGSAGIGELVSNVTIPEQAYAGLINTREAIGDLPAISAGQVEDYYVGPARLPFQQQARTLLGGTPMSRHELHDHYSAALGRDTLARLQHLDPGQDWRDLPFDLLPGSMKRALRKDHTRRYRRMTWDGVPRSIITRFRDPKSGEYTHPEQHRTISIREAARIQGFPDWFSFAGANTSKYTQVGNAIPVPLARAIAGEVAACLGGMDGRARLLDPFRRRPNPMLGRFGELAERAAA